MKLGVTFPQNIIGGDQKLVRDFAQMVEGLGYSHNVAFDHVLGLPISLSTPSLIGVTSVALRGVICSPTCLSSNSTLMP